MMTEVPFVIPEGDGPANGKNHGLSWLDSHQRALTKLCTDGASLDAMCLAMGRGRAGIIARLRSLNLIKHGEAGTLVYTQKGLPMSYESYTSPMPPKAATVAESKNSPEIYKEHVAISIRGRLGKTMSDQDIFQAIAEIENELRALLCVEHKPAKLLEYIRTTREDIARIVFYVDNR